MTFVNSFQLANDATQATKAKDSFTALQKQVAAIQKELKEAADLDANLADPAGLGESIAVAFIATLIGVGSANILWLPVSGNLKGKDQAEARERRLALAAILAIQAGDNPRIVAQKLSAHAGPERAVAAASPEAAPAGATVGEAA